MSQQINDNFDIKAPKPLDAKYSLVESGAATPYASTDDVFSTIGIAYRYRGLTVMVEDGSGLKEYWFKTGVQNEDLTLKISDAAAQINSDWNQTDPSSLAYIENKPTIPTNTSQLTNDSNFTVSGITNIIGTTNQVNASRDESTFTLSLPQSIDVAANVTFGSLVVSKNYTSTSNITNVLFNPAFDIQANFTENVGLTVDPTFTDSSTGVNLYSTLGPLTGFTDGSYANISTTTSGSGTGAKVYISVSDSPLGAGTIYPIISTAGTGYAPGDTINVPSGAWGNAFQLLVNTVGHIDSTNLGIDSTPNVSRFGGSMLLSDTSNNNVGFGYAISKFGVRNTMFGAQASPTLSVNSQQNTAIGFGSLFNITDGSYNVGVGDHALFSNVIGNYNTAIGQNAIGAADLGTPQYPGDYNTAIGAGALSNLNTGGKLNTAVGANAGYYIGTGSRNIIIGTNINLLNPNDNDKLLIGSEGTTWLYGDLGALSAPISFGTPLFQIVKATPPGSFLDGNIWYQTSDSRLRFFTQGAATDFILSTNNLSLAGSSGRFVVADSNGSLTATLQSVEAFVADSDVISAITSATYNSGNNYVASIVPAGLKVFNQGQMYQSGQYLYIAVADNASMRISGG